MIFNTDSHYQLSSLSEWRLQFSQIEAWNIGDATYTGDFGEVNNLQGIDVSLDGETLWVCSRTDEKVYEYDIDPAWDITSVSEPPDAEFDFSGDIPENYPSSVAHGVQIRRTGGEKLYIFNRREIFEYDLATDYDITTATLSGVKDLSTNVDRGHDFDFKPDGTELFIDDRINEDLHQYSLSTPWDVTTASIAHTHDISEHGSGGWQGLDIGDGGHLLYVVERDDDRAHQFRMSDPYDLTTISHERSIVTPHGGILSTVVWNPDGEQFFVSEYSNHRIHEYVLGGY